MARLISRLVLETEPIQDAIQEIMLASEALPRRHGVRFRDLERRIAGLDTSDITTELHDLGDGRFTCTSRVLTDLICDARALGVI